MSTCLPLTSEATVTGKSAGGPLRMPWKRAIAMGRAFELLRGDAMMHLAYVQSKLGFEYCRFHGLFHDDMAVAVRDANGKLYFQWHQVDKVLDGLRGIGLRPFVELGPMPRAMASGTQTMFAWGMNVTPPREWQEWAQLIEAFTRHVTSRYGREEVRRWYFEVWNEPNLDIFWAGSQADYFILYEYAARSIRNVDGSYKVGGPATARAEWIPELLLHCRRRNLPLDFISTHSYAQDEFVLYPGRKGSPFAPGEYLADIYRKVNRMVKEFDPRLELHWTEWNSLTVSPEGNIDWVSNPTVDSCAGGAFVAAHALATESQCESLAYWTASDIFEEMGLAHQPFSGTYGLVNIHGIPKATFRAMELVSRLEGDRLEVSSAGSPAGCGLAATLADDDSIRILLWNNPPPGSEARGPWSLRLRLPKAAARAVLISTRLAPHQGSAYETWIELGRPGNLSLDEVELLRAHSAPEVSLQIHESSAREIELVLQLDSQEVLLLNLRPSTIASPVERGSSDNILAWAAGMGSPERSA